MHSLRLPEVVDLDRAVDLGWATGGNMRLYGWIQRKDSRRDFVLLEIAPMGKEDGCDEDGTPEVVDWVTSSAKYSNALFRFFSGPHDFGVEHIPCITADEALERMQAQVVIVWMCRVCGCSEDDGCEGGCSWVEADLCSRCVEAGSLQTSEAG